MEAGSPPRDPFDKFFPQHQCRDSDAEADDDEASLPSASNYSSCDGEGSELDRYCSANSVLGSASVCSSVGNYGDLLDFSDSPVCDRINRTLDEGGVASPREWGSSNRMGSFSGMRTPSRLHPAYVNRLGESARLGEVEGQQDGLSVGRDDGCSGQMSLLPTTANAEEFGRAVIDVDAGTSNRDELSEGEDSMLDYGTDCENSTGQHAKRNFKYIEGMKCEDVNPLLMNSSVAFGSDDLDEFLQENGGFDLHYPSLDQDQSALLQFVPAKDEKNVPSLANNRVIELHNAVEEKEIVADESVASVQAQITDQPDQPDQSVRASPIRNPLDAYGDSDKEMSLTVEHPMEDQIKHMLKGIEGGIYSLDDGIIVDVDVHEAAEKQVFGELVPVDHAINEIFFSFSAGASQSEQSYSQEHDKPRSSLPVLPNSQSSSFQIELNKNSKFSDLTEEDVVTDENKKQNTGDAYEEMVLEMEEILLDNGTSNGTRFGANLGYLNHQGYRDGSSTASTSGTDEIYPPAQYPTASRIDWVEVIGAKQRTGDVSFGERLIGVKEYTVYILRVWSANDQWEVERRYRDFCSLYQQLKTLFSEHGLSLPSEWVFAERESMNFFGNASPIVVSKRSSLIQDCLRSVLNSRYPFGFPSPLLSFLSPGKVASNSSLLKAIVPQSLQKIGEGWNIKFLTHGGSSEDVSELGKTISLVVDIKPHKSMQQLLELQHYTCAGCHKNLDAGKTLFGELVQTLGWKKPRLCEYTGQLFCASCHTNDTSVLPAKVLHLWDFSVYPVSQLAKAYLESIYDKPMLCVSAMNPFLFSKVPALLHVMGIRKKIAAMVPYIRCPFRISVQRGLGSRRHLLESNDFFALRDLVDLSKGAFAALPIMLETVSNKILEHITQQCLVCYDTGVPCAARQVCDEPLSLIFPFQEAETARCGSCGSIFHKSCFIKIINCPCRKPTSEVRNRGKDHGHSQELLDEHGEPSESSSTSNLFSNILTIARPDRIWKTRGRNPVILMGSLPNSTL